MTEPLLSAIMLAGARRKNAQHVLDELCGQTAIDSMEVIVVDHGRPGAAPLQSPCVARTRILRLDPGLTMGPARAAAVREARGEIVAFIEDHCHPQPDWAQALIDCHRQGWPGVVGYAFTNATTETPVSRAAFMTDFGWWADPVPRGPVTFLPGNNLAYRRTDLLEFGDALEALLEVDWTLIELLVRRGVGMFVESKALVAHEEFDRVGAMCRANFVYGRMLAAVRSKQGGWGPVRRTVYALGAPLGVPALKLLRMIRSLKGRGLWRRFAVSLPLATTIYLAEAVGESVGYLRGAEGMQRAQFHWGVDAERGESAPRS
jgi:hypothetical protein